jgi:integrase
MTIAALASQLDAKVDSIAKAVNRGNGKHFVCDDLRREAGSRWHEGGFQLHEVRDLLGHANVSQTDTYLSAKIAGLRESMKRFDAVRGKPVAKPTAIEQRPLSHDPAEEGRKEPLH